MDAMEVDEATAAEHGDIPSDRIEAFELILGQHVMMNHLDQISISDIEQLVNREAAIPYTRHQVSSILEHGRNRLADYLKKLGGYTTTKVV